MSFNLIRRKQVYYFRLWVPLDVRDFIGRAELKKSLQTKDRNHAKTLAKALNFRVERLFMQIRSGMLTKDQI